MLCVPSVNGVVGVNDHLPSEPTVVVPKTVLPSYTVIVVPAVPVPLIKGDASFVELPLLTLPVIGCLSSKTVAGVVGVAGVNHRRVIVIVITISIVRPPQDTTCSYWNGCPCPWTCFTVTI